MISSEVTRPPRRKNSRKKPKKPTTPSPPAKETSVITLYVSGRTPGDFSTVLSTVVVDEDNQKRRRRDIDVPVEPSKVINSEVTSFYSYLDSYVTPALEQVNLENTETSIATESLESVIGDVNKYMVTQTPELFNIKPSKSKVSKKYEIKYVKISNSGHPQQMSGNFLVL
jgi:hypothetical protein